MAEKQTLEQKQNEKARLLKQYRVWRKEEWKRIVEMEPRMVSFRKWMRQQSSPSALVVIADSWLRYAHDDVKYAALRIIEKQSGKIAEYQGREALDDPMPGQMNVYFVARSMFGVK